MGNAAVRLLLFFAVFLSFCAKDPGKPEKLKPTDQQTEKYYAVIDRLERDHTENGWVVTRRPDGSPEHMGDSLIWTGTALAYSPCDRLLESEQTLNEMVGRLNGALVRYEPLGEYQNGRHISLDGAVGFWAGLARRGGCRPAEWSYSIDRHVSFLRSSDRRLHPESNATYPPGYEYVPYIIADIHLGSDLARRDLRNLLLPMMDAWPALVMASKKACFRLNLALTTLKTLERLGDDVPRGTFCAVTEGSGILLIDHWCGRDGGKLIEWLDRWEPGAWEYEWQRCPGWESPDGDGDSVPVVDFLAAFDQAFEI